MGQFTNIQMDLLIIYKEMQADGCALSVVWPTEHRKPLQKIKQKKFTICMCISLYIIPSCPYFIGVKYDIYPD